MLGEVIARLREMIAEGELEPGLPIRERTIGRELGVSRTPLREAFRVLAGEGLIEIRPRLGARVARLSARNADHSPSPNWGFFCEPWNGWRAAKIAMA